MKQQKKLKSNSLYFKNRVCYLEILTASFLYSNHKYFLTQLQAPSGLCHFLYFMTLCFSSYILLSVYKKLIY